MSIHHFKRGHNAVATMTLAVLITLAPIMSSPAWAGAKLAYSKADNVELYKSGDDSSWCGATLAIEAKAETQAKYESADFASLLNKVGQAILPFECDQATSVTVTGMADGTPVWTGTMTKEGGWALTGHAIAIAPTDPPATVAKIASTAAVPTDTRQEGSASTSSAEPNVTAEASITTGAAVETAIEAESAPTPLEPGQASATPEEPSPAPVPVAQSETSFSQAATVESESAVSNRFTYDQILEETQRRYGTVEVPFAQALRALLDSGQLKSGVEDRQITATALARATSRGERCPSSDFEIHRLKEQMSEDAQAAAPGTGPRIKYLDNKVKSNKRYDFERGGYVISIPPITRFDLAKCIRTSNIVGNYTLYYPDFTYINLLPLSIEEAEKLDPHLRRSSTHFRAELLFESGGKLSVTSDKRPHRNRNDFLYEDGAIVGAKITLGYEKQSWNRRDYGGVPDGYSAKPKWYVYYTWVFTEAEISSAIKAGKIAHIEEQIAALENSLSNSVNNRYRRLERESQRDLDRAAQNYDSSSDMGKILTYGTKRFVRPVSLYKAAEELSSPADYEVTVQLVQIKDADKGSASVSFPTPELSLQYLDSVEVKDDSWAVVRGALSYRPATSFKRQYNLAIAAPSDIYICKQPKCAEALDEERFTARITGAKPDELSLRAEAEADSRRADKSSYEKLEAYKAELAKTK